jgi:hypothetical protein
VSTPDTGEKGFAAHAIADAKQLLAAEEEQLSLLDPPTAEELAIAREELGRLGRDAGHMSVLRHARDQRSSGRKRGSRNKRTDDFAKWILQFGQHPARTLMEVQSTPEPVLIELSKRKITRVTRSGQVVEFSEEMSFAEARALRVRAAEALMPYLESKKPVAVDVSFAGVSDLIIEGVTHSEREVRDIVDAEFMELEDQRDQGEGQP